MGSVANLTTTGDNDPEIYPVRYYQHYLYCDHCGSFELKPWIEHENHRFLAATAKLLGRLALALLVVTVGLVVLELTGAILGVLLTAFYAAILARFILKRKIKNLGLRCAACRATYADGSVFFSRFKENPKRLTMDDVPRPLYRVQNRRGEELGPAPPEKSHSRLP